MAVMRLDELESQTGISLIANTTTHCCSCQMIEMRQK